MKKILICLGILLILQTGSRAFAYSEVWLTDFEKAKQEATEKKLPILAVFAGSDWCSWCIALEKEVLTKAEFNKYAKDSLVLFLADFPQSKKLPETTVKQNEKLAAQYDVEAFPTVLVLNAEGKVTGKTGYLPGGPKKYIEHLKTLTKH